MLALQPQRSMVTTLLLQILRGIYNADSGEAKEYYANWKIDAGDSISGTGLDIAQNKWGDKWRMPSMDEFEELVNNCSLNFSGHGGIKFTSNINGISVEFPYAGEITR